MVFFTREVVAVGFKRNSVCLSSQLYACTVYYSAINISFFSFCGGAIMIYTSYPSNAIVNLPPSSKNYESEINAGYHAHEMWVRLYNYDITFGNISDNAYFLDRTSNQAGKLGYWRSSENLMLPSVII
jgi:hypothetical protein